MGTFFRVANNETKQGLWYDEHGNFTGLIHKDFDFCKNSRLPMPFDPEVMGWLSATTTLEELFGWFPPEDILKLEKKGYFITIYAASEYKFYKGHWLISQKSSKILKIRSLLHLV